jgi:peptidoglycan/LPS O-acetylase OafA/YrhL
MRRQGLPSAKSRLERLRIAQRLKQAARGLLSLKPPRLRPDGLLTHDLWPGMRAAAESGWGALSGAPTRAKPVTATATATRVAGASNNFNFLRLAGALLVIAGHEGLDATGTGGMRLMMFFAISGYLVCGSWRSDPHAGRFLLRRLLRIWPAYAVTIVLCAVLSFIFPAPDMPRISRMASVFYLQNLWYSGFDWGFFPAANPCLNMPLWMMRYELNLYLALAAIGLLRGRLLAAAAACVFAAALASAPPMHPVYGGLLACWSLYFSGFFAAGILLREFPALRQGMPVALCVMSGLGLLWLGSADARHAALLMIIPAGAVWLGEQSWPLMRSAARFGDLSLGIFLWGWPVHQLTQLWVRPGTPGWICLALVAAQASLLAWVSWHFIESPALRLKPGKPQISPAVPDPA